MSKAKILIDSCFWIALYTPEKVEEYSKALDIIDDLEYNDVLIPWPTLYEFVNTRLARHKENLFAFQQFLLKPNITKISDEKYKERALNNIFELNISHHASISLVDEILRQIILDKSLNIDYLVTFNRYDFEYLCQKSNVIILE